MELREQVSTLSTQLKRVARDYECLLARFRARTTKMFRRNAERLHPDQFALGFEVRS